MPRVHIIAGDVRWNFGDTAICLGVISLIRKAMPEAEICVCSPLPILSEGFEGVTFISGNWRRFLLTARKADWVIWGGGQLLQGNRSMVKIPYWWLRIGLLRLIGKPVVGMAQGVGPWVRRTDRWLAVRAVRMTRAFSVRDAASQQLLRDAGVDPSRSRLTADPAVIPAMDHPLPRGGKVRADPGAPSRPRIGISVRYTLHHRTTRMIPFQFLPDRIRQRQTRGARYEHFLGSLRRYLSQLRERLNARLTFIPTYPAPWESDLPLAQALADSFPPGDTVEIVRPRRSLNELLSAMDRQDMFIGTSMHSTLLATARRVPTLALFYEPKGHDYFQSIGQAAYAVSLDDLLTDAGRARLLETTLLLWENRARVREQLQEQMARARERAEANGVVLEAARAAGK